MMLIRDTAWDTWVLNWCETCQFVLSCCHEQDLTDKYFLSKGFVGNVADLVGSFFKYFLFTSIKRCQKKATSTNAAY